MRGLREGDTLAIVAASSAVKADEVEGGLKWLASEGLKARTMPHAFDPADGLVVADAVRIRDLREAIEDPEIAAIWCARGGYGAIRVLEAIDWGRLAKSGKPVIGFSDATALIAAVVAKGGVGLHGPMPTSFARERDAYVWESLHNAMRGGDPFPPACPAAASVVPGVAQGVLVGGCLTLVSDLVGGPIRLDFRDKIVALEDTNERPHRIDAMLTRLIQAGLGRASGIVVGAFVGTDGNVDPEIGGTPWRTIVGERLGALNIPLVTDLPFGHVRNPLTLPMGASVELDATAGRLRLLEPFVR